MNVTTAQASRFCTLLVACAAPAAHALGPGAWCVRDGSAPSFALSDDATPACCSCACDWDQSGLLSFDDLMMFSMDWFNLEADYDHNGATSLDDAIGFMECFLDTSNIAPEGDSPMLRAQGMDY
jgi:hypothetical protein